MGKLKFLLVLFCAFQCGHKSQTASQPIIAENSVAKAPGEGVVTGAMQLDLLLPKLKAAKVGLVVNHTSLIGSTHLADTLLKQGVNLVKIFAPEHGFRGDAADGQFVNDSIDKKTGIPLLSLHGAHKKPTPAQVADLDIIVFDIQDVGARFYTYISTLHYIMETCAENGKKLIVLDRPNPNGNYVDGPIRKPEFKYFLAMHPIPIVHGLTIGELAQMINGESWLDSGQKCDLTIIKLKNWKHADTYSLPERPSPNLPNDQSIKLYPSLCLFEQTDISVGRGTTMQFQVLGSPALKNMNFQFTPVSMKGISNTPPHENKTCYGIDLRTEIIERKFDLSYLLTFYKLHPNKEKFFLNYFDNLAGTKDLRQQIIKGVPEAEIRASWEPELSQYKEMRKKYLLYE